MGFLSSVGDAISSASDFISGNSGLFDFAEPFIAGGLSYMGQSSANAFNAAEAEKNRQFQAWMRSTQYQAAVQDLKKAGLNPMLAYQQGGAGNLSGAVSAPAQNALGQFTSSALQARQMRAEAKNLEATNQQIKDQSYLARQQAHTEVARAYRETQAGINDAKIADAQVRLMAAQARNYDANSAYTALQSRLGEFDVPRKSHDAAINETSFGKLLHNWNYIWRNSRGLDR